MCNRLRESALWWMHLIPSCEVAERPLTAIALQSKISFSAMHLQSAKIGSPESFLITNPNPPRFVSLTDPSHFNLNHQKNNTGH